MSIIRGSQKVSDWLESLPNYVFDEYGQDKDILISWFEENEFVFNDRKIIKQLSIYGVDKTLITSLKQENNDDDEYNVCLPQTIGCMLILSRLIVNNKHIDLDQIFNQSVFGAKKKEKNDGDDDIVIKSENNDDDDDDDDDDMMIHIETIMQIREDFKKLTLRCLMLKYPQFFVD